MKKKLPPMLIIIIGFIIIIFVGAFFLYLPISQEGEGLSFFDSLFISTSAVCITGLSPVTNLSACLSPFGKVVIAVLIQIGGLGFVTVAIFILTMLGAKIGPTERYLIKDALNQNSAKGVVKLVKDIIIMTLIIEVVGAMINMIVFMPMYKIGEAIGVSFFHSLSSFNSAGFEIFGPGVGMQDPRLANNILLNINTSILVFLGGLGFIVIRDLIINKRWSALSIHSKIVIKVSGLLVVGGAVLLILGNIKNPDFKWYQAIFMSINSRTSGFSVVSLQSINSISMFVITILMLIGASPSSTGGGIKTTTFYTMIRSISSFSKGKRTTTYGKLISEESKNKAFLITVFAVTIVFVGAIGLLFLETAFGHNLTTGSDTEAELTIGKALFEVASAFSTTGYTIGVTPKLHGSSQTLLALIMFIGRLGPLTVLSIWNRRWNIVAKDEIKLIEEKILIG